MNSARAARLIQTGEPLVLEDVQLPPPAADEVAVTLAYAGVNPIDRYTALGQAPVTGPLPRTLGGEASGWTEDGQLVVIAGSSLGMGRDGLYATHAIVPREAVVAVPDGIDPAVAGAVGIAGLTAYNVANLVAPAPGESVLVLGAGGGVGLPLVSYLTSLGAYVYAQVGTESKVDAVLAAGARKVVVSDAAGLTQSLRVAAGDDSFAPDAVVDSLGGDFVDVLVTLLPVGGRYVLYGTSAGRDVCLNWQAVYRKGLRISGYGGLVLSADQRRAGLREVLDVLARGEMRIPIYRVYPLAEVNDALGALADRAVSGKVLLDLREPAAD